MICFNGSATPLPHYPAFTFGALARDKTLYGYDPGVSPQATFLRRYAALIGLACALDRIAKLELRIAKLRIKSQAQRAKSEERGAKGKSEEIQD